MTVYSGQGKISQARCSLVSGIKRLLDSSLGFLNYYDACLEGLKSVHPSLQLGGPAEGLNAFYLSLQPGGPVETQIRKDTYAAVRAIGVLYMYVS